MAIRERRDAPVLGASRAPAIARSPKRQGHFKTRKIYSYLFLRLVLCHPASAMALHLRSIRIQQNDVRLSHDHHNRRRLGSSLYTKQKA